jgi:hypothetical protein
VGPESRAWGELAQAYEFAIGQAFVGLAAFQGISTRDMKPLDQEPVTANFRRITISPIDH